MDLTNATFIGLMGIGFVNVLTFYKPGMDSRVKFALLAVFIFCLTFIPDAIANTALAHIKLALETAFAASGAYKLATKAGGPTGDISSGQ